MNNNQPNILPLADIGTPECRRWRDKIFHRYGLFRSTLEYHYRRIATEQDYVAANRWLGEIAERMQLGGTGLTVDDDWSVVDEYAKAKAKASESLIHEAYKRLGAEGMLTLLRHEVERTGLTFPLEPEKEHSNGKKVGALARLCDESWWRRKLLAWQSRELEGLARELGLVNKKAGAYISNIGLARRKARKKDNRKLLEKLQAKNEQGQTYTLAELADLSVSNPALRRAELMVRMRGFENIANDSGSQYAGVFYTLTCPSKYHAYSKTGQRNPKFNGATPADAQDYLNTLWQRVRAAWQRAGIASFGMRVVEPHHDGTPHWHLLLFFETPFAQQATRIFRKHAFEEDGDEPGAQEHRFTVVDIDPQKGSATGYIAKYISKNIDGYGIDADTYGLDAKDSAQRIEASASTWGIRQFQQIGGASVTVWRELRRLGAETLDATLLVKLIQAADTGEWDVFNELMGGAICQRTDRPVRPMYLTKAEENRYGEIIKKLSGLFYCSSKVVSRIHTWLVSIVKPNTPNEVNGENTGGDEMSYLNSGLALPPDSAYLEFCQ
ncbi:replication endonuclease [Teredinibacter turnerae]|uniref:replication endonuclease n=1 Tax=Teredinibacter turnerae TaxID=2426 RepID=UPI0004131FC3|nr:replication endonuclease [Teredinibacter turnerae]